MQEDGRKSLNACFPFASPYLHAEHRMGLEEYCEGAARGHYWRHALTDRCYVASTQAFVLPDGSQHWCGAHAIRRPPPLGNVQASTLRANMRANISRWAEYPNDYCTSRAGATCVINQAAHRNLKKQLGEQLREHDS